MIISTISFFKLKSLASYIATNLHTSKASYIHTHRTGKRARHLGRSGGRYERIGSESLTYTGSERFPAPNPRW